MRPSKILSLPRSSNANQWQPGKLSKSGTSGLESSAPGKPRSFQRKPSQPLTYEAYHFHTTQQAHSPSAPHAPRKRIPLFHPETPQIFLKCLTKQSPDERKATLQSSLANIPGMHKIPLLISLQNARYPRESAAVYKALVDNGLVANLSYADHHRQLHLLKSMHPLESKDSIVLCWRQLNTVHSPAVNMYSVMFGLALQWNDPAFAKEVYQTMAQHASPFETEGFNDYIGAIRNDTSVIHAWNKSIHTIIPTLTTIKRGLDIFSTRGDVNGIQSCLAIESENTISIRKDYEMVIQKGRSANATSYSLILMNTIQSAWIELGDYEKATAVFDSYRAMNNQFNNDSFNLNITLASKQGRINDFESLFLFFEQRGAKAETVTYGKIIEAFGRQSNLNCANMWYHRSIEKLRVDVGGKKWIQLTTCLIHAHVLSKNYKEAIKLFESVNGKGFRSTFRYAIAAYCGVGDVVAAINVLKDNRDYFQIGYNDLEQHILGNSNGNKDSAAMNNI